MFCAFIFDFFMRRKIRSACAQPCGCHEVLSAVCCALQNQAFDVIGEFGFSKDYEATTDLWKGSGAKACMALKNGEWASKIQCKNVGTMIRKDWNAMC